MADRQVFKIQRGDTAPRLRAQCLDDTTPVSLATAASARLLMRNTAALVIASPVTIEDQTANPGWWHRAWATGDTATADTYKAQLEVTWSDGTIQTFPVDGYAYVYVVPDLG